MNKGLDGLKGIYPNTILLNELFTKDGDEIDPFQTWEYIVSTVANILSASGSFKPQLELNSKPIPNAGATETGKERIRIFGGLPHYFSFLGEVTSHLLKLFGPGTELPLDDIHSIKLPQACIESLDRLSEKYIASRNTNWTHYYVPQNAPTDSIIYHFMISVVIFHELGHLENRHTENWNRMRDMTKARLHSFLKNSNYITDDWYPSDKVIECWTSEAIADQLAYDILRNNYKSREEYTMIHYAFGLTFGMLELFERIQGQETYSTHPPTRLRRDLFNYIRALDLNMDPTMYWIEKNGAGFICGMMFDDYINSRFS